MVHIRPKMDGQKPPARDRTARRPNQNSEARIAGRGRLLLGSLLFFGLTLGIFAYQFGALRVAGDMPSWSELRWGYMLLMLLAVPVEPLAAGLRIWLVSRVIHPGLGLWTCVKTDLANIAVSMLTPSQTGGGAAQVYMLSRKGVRTGTALTLCLVSFAGTLAALLCTGLYSLLVSGSGHTAPFFATAGWVITPILLLIGVTLIWPQLFRSMLAPLCRISPRIRSQAERGRAASAPGEDAARKRIATWATTLIDLAETYRGDILSFARAGKTTFVCVCLLSVVILLARALLAYLCIRFLGLDASTLRGIIDAQLALIFVIFFAPTPGAAGLAEAASSTVLAHVLPEGFVPYYHLLWRFSTLYISAIAGACYLARTLLQDAGMFAGRRRRAARLEERR